MLGLRAISEFAICEFSDLVVPPDPEEPPDPGPDDPPVLETPPVLLDTVIQRYATRSFVTRSTDTPPQTFIPKRLSRGGVVGRALSPGPDGQFGGLIVSTIGELEFINSDGGLDFLIDDYASDGRPVTFKVGQTEVDEYGREVVIPFDNFQQVFVATAGIWSVETDVVRLRMKDPGIILQRGLQTARYGGTGGQQGTVDMKGRTLPVTLGRVLNISPQQVDPVFLTYQVHDGIVSSIPFVYDAGVSVPGEGAGSPAAITDYPSYSALAGATVTAGTFATNLSGGYFRLGTSPFGIVTADVDGDATDGDWTSTHGTVMRRVLEKYSWMETDRINFDAFSALHQLNSHIIGLYLPAGDESTIEQVMERIAISCGAVVGQDLEGMYGTVRIDAPLSTASHELNDANMTEINRAIPQYGVPFKAWTVEGVRNWTVLEGSQVASSVGQSRHRFLENEVRSTTVEVPGVSPAHPTSANAVRHGLFHFISHTGEEAIRLAALYSLGRTLYRITCKGFLFRIDIGQTVRVTYPRWNLSEGRNFVVVAVTDDLDARETELEVFG